MRYQLLIGKKDFDSTFKKLSTNVLNIDEYIREAQDLDLKDAMGYPLFFDMIKNYGTENATIKLSAITGTFTAAQVITADNGATAKIVSYASPNVVIKTLAGDWNNATTVTTVPTAGAGIIDEFTAGKYYQLVNGATYTDYNTFLVQYNGIRPALIYWSYARYVARGAEQPTATGLVFKETPYSSAPSAKSTSDKITQARSAASGYWHDSEKFLADMYIKDPTLFPLYANALAYKTEVQGGGARVSRISRNRRNRNKQCPDDGYGI